MACVSDIDLATLHRNRLEERVQYKLSWWARRMISNTLKESPSTVERYNQRMVQCNAIPNPTDSKPTVITDQTPMHATPKSPPARGRHYTDRHRDLLRGSQTNDHQEYAVKTGEEIDTNKNDLRLFEKRFKDEDYFTTEHRRRSGTWP